MESESQQARSLGYPSAEYWLAVAAAEATWGIITPERLVEYDTIFYPRRALTRFEFDLLEALSVPVDWDWLQPYLVDDRLSPAATTAKYRALEALDRQ
jgi:hypothetical protein